MSTPKQDALVAFVTLHPGCTMLTAAEQVGPHGSRRYGYRIIHRALKANLVSKQERDDHPGWYRLYPVR